MKSSKKWLIIALVIVLIIIAIVVGIIVTRKKGNGVTFLKSNNNYNLDLKDKFVEDDYQKVTVTDIAVADNYFFIKYDIDLTDKGQKLVAETEVNNAESFSYGLNRIIRVNGDEIDADAGISYEISEKIADNKIRTYDIIKMDSIPEKFTIDIDFVKTYETEELSSEQAALEDAVFKEHDETTAGDMVEEYVEEPEEDIDYEIEEIDEEPEELEMEEIDPILDIELAGRKTFNGTKEEAQKNVEIKKLNGSVKGENLSINAESLVKTSFGEFLIAKTEVDNINSNSTADPDIIKIDIQDKDNNTIDCKSAYNIELIDTDEYDSEGEELLKAENTTIFLVNDKMRESEKILLQPYSFEHEYEKENVTEIMNDLNWHPIENVEQYELNEFEGKVTVKSVEQKDGAIYFEIEKNGFVPTHDRLIVIRNENDPQDFCVATENIEREDGICVYFEKQQVDAVLKNDNINNLRYTIMEPIIYTKVTDAIEITL